MAHSSPDFVRQTPRETEGGLTRRGFQAVPMGCLPEEEAGAEDCHLTGVEAEDCHPRLGRHRDVHGRGRFRAIG